MSKYTPGPWRQCVGNAATEIRGEPAGGQSNPRVCRVLRNDPNENANARLIEAAPDLLAALKAYVEADAPMNGSTSRAEAHNARLAAALAAIAKAEGGAA